MLKSIKKALLLSSLSYSFVLPMRQVVQVALTRTMNQAAFFRNSSPARCPLSAAAIAAAAQMVENVQPTKIEARADGINLSDAGMSADNQQLVNDLSRGDEVRNTQWYADSHPEPIATGWQNGSGGTAHDQFLSGNVEGVRELSSNAAYAVKLEQATKSLLAASKLEFSCSVAQFSTNVQQEACKLVKSCCSLLHHDVLAYRGNLARSLSVLENEFESLTRSNPNTYFIREATSRGFDDRSIPWHIQDRWTAVDYDDISAALELKSKIESTKIAIQECDIMIRAFEQEAEKFAQALERASFDAIEKEIMPDLAAKKGAVENSIAQKESKLSVQKNELSAINAQLEAFENRSAWKQFKEIFKADHSQEPLHVGKKAVEENIQKTNNQLGSFRSYQKELGQRIAFVQSRVDTLRAQRSESWAALDAKLLNQTHALIVKANVNFIGFSKISPEAQQCVVGLVNRAAHEQAIIGDASYDKVLTATVQIADTACQAYAKGNVEFGSALINFGNAVLDCTAAFSKGFVHGVGQSMQNNWNAVKHPLDTLTSLAEGVVDMARMTSKYDDLLLPCPTRSLIAFGRDMTTILENTTQALKDVSVEEMFGKFGEKAGEFGVDFVIFDGALKGASIVKNITVAEVAAITKKAEKSLAAMGEFAKAEIAALAESREVLAATAEGFDVAVNAKRADIAKGAEALHSEMSSVNKGKISVKSEGCAAGASKGAVKFGPNGSYSDAGYHHFQSKGNIKSKGPKNGQKALDNSIPFKIKGNQNFERRIGVEKDYFVILDEHRPGEFHGHIRKWEELCNKEGTEIRNALYEAGIVKNHKTGKI